jgi:3-deoxy-manno-octulosonate cytidylyltransferase (CMP-KDO synthetase)
MPLKKKILHKICKLPQSRNEIREKLEQLRWLDNDFSIRVGITNFQTISVDTPSDIKKIEAQII